jgi:hypothetical protein
MKRHTSTPCKTEELRSWAMRLTVSKHRGYARAKESEGRNKGSRNRMKIRPQGRENIDNEETYINPLL